jgi:hypothetical protein
MPHKVDNTDRERSAERVHTEDQGLEPMMTNPQNETHYGRHLQSALDHARRLSEPGAAHPDTSSWSVQAAHVGDMSVLLLALRS